MKKQLSPSKRQNDLVCLQERSHAPPQGGAFALVGGGDPRRFYGSQGNSTCPRFSKPSATGR